MKSKREENLSTFMKHNACYQGRSQLWQAPDKPPGSISTGWFGGSGIPSSEGRNQGKDEILKITY